MCTAIRGWLLILLVLFFICLIFISWEAPFLWLALPLLYSPLHLAHNWSFMHSSSTQQTAWDTFILEPLPYDQLKGLFVSTTCLLYLDIKIISCCNVVPAMFVNPTCFPRSTSRSSSFLLQTRPLDLLCRVGLIVCSYKGNATLDGALTLVVDASAEELGYCYCLQNDVIILTKLHSQGPLWLPLCFFVTLPLPDPLHHGHATSVLF